MGADKLRKFAEYNASKHSFDFNNQTAGTWHAHFGNTNPIVVELACGKGDYTVNLAQLNPHINYIGVDIKGNRMWRGLKTIEEKNISNAAFLRIEIDTITQYFAPGEVSELWITFPDPQLKKERKRLTHPKFLNQYLQILGGKGIINFKLDSQELLDFTKEVIHQNQLPILQDIANVYALDPVPPILAIQTHYEKMWLAQGRIIKFLQFQLHKTTTYTKLATV